MTNKELHEEINYLKTKLAKLEEKIVELPKRADGGIFKPKNGQKYWFLSGSGEIYTNTWYNDSVDRNRCAIGNCYQTEQAAEDAVRVLKLTQKARESQDGFVPDWDDEAQEKYYLYYEYNDETQEKYYLYYEYNGIWVGSNFSMNIATIFGYWRIKSVCEEFIKDNYADIVWFFTEYRRRVVEDEI